MEDFGQNVGKIERNFRAISGGVTCNMFPCKLFFSPIYTSTSQLTAFCKPLYNNVAPKNGLLLYTTSRFSHKSSYIPSNSLLPYIYQKPNLFPNTMLRYIFIPSSNTPTTPYPTSPEPLPNILPRFPLPSPNPLFKHPRYKRNRIKGVNGHFW